MATHHTPDKKPPAKKSVTKKPTASTKKPAAKKSSTRASTGVPPTANRDAGMLTPPAPPLEKEVTRPHTSAEGSSGAGQPSAAGTPETVPVQPILETDARTFSMLTHLGGVLLGWSGLGWVPALIFYVIYKDRSLLVREHGREELNLQISILIWAVSATILSVVTLGLGAVIFLPALVVMVLVAFIMQIIASVKAYQGEYYHYGIAFPIIR